VREFARTVTRTHRTNPDKCLITTKLLLTARPRPFFPNALKAPLARQPFRDYRIYVYCEADEDIPYLAEFIGADHLMIGSNAGW